MLAKKFALGFGLAVLLPFLVFYGVSTFSPPPKYDDYRVKNYCSRMEGASKEEKVRLREQQEQLELSREQHEKQFQQHLFTVSAPVGLIALIAGALLSVEAVGTGLMFGGVLTFVEGIICYWSELQDGMKFGLLLVAFIILIVIGYRKLGGSKVTKVVNV